MCARLCHERGGELGQIQLSLGHGIQMAECYLGDGERLRDGVQRFNRNRAGTDSTLTLADFSVLIPRTPYLGSVARRFTETPTCRHLVQAHLGAKACPRQRAVSTVRLKLFVQPLLNVDGIPNR